MDSRSQRELIDRIRQEKFGIGATKSNPLAGMLHEAIVSLSAELYQKDIHFISELLQNAEDNVYPKGVTPSLELVLTRTDITGVGAPATLILFNNEVGFQPEHVEALCAVGMSTKKGKRNSGYIGEKGIGFKSVFLVTRSPYVISNGYRFRFTDEASNAAKIGYVVPEWVEEPTDADLKRVYGKSKLPQTMIILPLRPDKVEPVREQLKQVAPETLLFLSKLRQVNVRQDSDGSNNLCIIRSDIEPPTNEVSTVNLSVGSRVNHVQEQSKYFLLQEKFPVTQRVEQRKEVDNWVITIAFPLRDRINPGQLTGDIFAFLPSDLASGFPFVVNADFLLVSSRETLKFDSPWNTGILSCIPAIFRKAFDLCLQKTSQAASGVQMTAPVLATRDAYKFVPVRAPQQPELGEVRQRILDDLKADDCVLVDALAGPPVGGNQFCKPEMARLISPEFRNILVAAKEERNFSFNSSPAIRNSPWRIVDGQIQEVHAATLIILGVTNMTEDEYLVYVKHEDWILSLSERLYWDVVSFVLNFCYYFPNGGMKTVPILKYCKADGSIALASVQQARNKNVEIFMSPSEQGKRVNAEWTSVFKPWVSLVFMPTSTVQTLRNLRPQGSHNICRILHYFDTVVLDLSVESYLERLLELLQSSVDPKFVILTTEFMYQCLQGKDIEKTDCLFTPITVVDQYSRVCRLDRYNSNILLPAHGSTWTKLSLNSWSSSTTVLSDDYVITPSAWPSRTKACISNKADPFVFHPYRSYLEDVFSASDIPRMVPLADSPYEMPKQLRLTMTIEQAYLLLKWLTNCLDRQSAREAGRSRFIKNIKDTEWLPTEAHGLRRPSLCFDRSSFGVFFGSTDVPCIHPSLSCFSHTLEGLGVVMDSKKGCEAVINYMLEMSNDSTGKHSCSLEQATRLYTYIHKFHSREPIQTSLQKLKIFVPRTSRTTSNSWKDRESCVIQDSDDFFGDMLIVLEGLFPSNLLPFFSEVLHVPKQATVEKYCQLWLKWRRNVHEITVGECTRVWKVLSEKWTKCNADIRKDFVSKAWVPSMSEITGTFQLSSPTDCFVPDNLHLLSLFAGRPGVHFVWYPDNTEKMESRMNKVYADMKVKNLSSCVQQEFIIGDDSGGDHSIQNQQVVAGKGILCPGLFRAILGFLARKKYGLLSSERQPILTSLKSVPEITIPWPLTSSWTISSLSPPVVATEDNVMALWSTKDRKFYCLDNENPILRNCLARRHFRTQVATAISYGLLSEHPLVADELTEFINVLICSGFESPHVEYELRRKNAKLFEEDELFLSHRQT